MLFLFLVTPHLHRALRARSPTTFTGAVVAVIGTTYAVILAFTLSGVWTMFQPAQANEEQEANALVNVYRIAMQLQDCRRAADPAGLRALRRQRAEPGMAGDGKTADDGRKATT